MMRELRHVPNLLSAARVPLAAAFPFARASAPLSIGVLGFAGLTDVLDGWTARKLGRATPAGAIIDGIADKVFAASVLGTLVGTRRLSPLAALLVATRELIELPLAFHVLASPRARVLEPRRQSNTLGKLATTLELGTVLAAVLNAPVTSALAIGTAAVGLLAGASYWRREMR